jgi:phospholipid transport system substrate-binding protein
MDKPMRPLYFLPFVGVIALALIIAPFTASASKEDASQFVDNLAKDALDTIGKSDLSKEEKQKRLQKLFSTHVDIDWIAKFVLGKNWRAATQEQQDRYLENYRSFLLKNYTSNFENFTDSRYEVVKAADGSKAGEYTVSMLLKRSGQEDIAVDYRLRQDGKSFKVVDIIAEGISLITSQRSEFNSVISRNGLDYLIDELKSKTVERK